MLTQATGTRQKEKDGDAEESSSDWVVISVHAGGCMRVAAGKNGEA